MTTIRPYQELAISGERKAVIFTLVNGGVERVFYIHQLGLPENRLFDHSAFVYGHYHWLLHLANRWECDDFKVGVSSGDFWKVFVR